LTELEDLPTERLRLRIACRPADWQVTLEQGFGKIWGESKVRVFELAPLRKLDVASAAELSNIDPLLFIDAIIRRDVVPLAIKPVTLEFLIGAFAKGGSLPASRAELYFEGCKRLCEEPNRHRWDSPVGRGKLAADQRLAIAARLAAVTQLSNRAAIWIGPEAGLEAEDVPQESLIGATEGVLSSEVAVDLTAVREVLGTGLFSSRGLSRQGWRHQTFAEYLAAYYLNVNRNPLERLRRVILHPDGSGKVIPQLRETAAWLAGMNSQIFQLLVRSDPEVLLRSDMAV
jgi:predicted NACHT family NTPase